MPVQPTASQEGAFWVVFDIPGDGYRFYSSHDVEADANELAADMNKAALPYQYRVMPKP